MKFRFFFLIHDSAKYVKQDQPLFFFFFLSWPHALISIQNEASLFLQFPTQCFVDLSDTSKYDVDVCKCKGNIREYRGDIAWYLDHNT